MSGKATTEKNKIKKAESLPEGWKRVRLGEIAQIIMGQSPNSAFINKEGKGMPFLQGNAEFTQKFPVPIYWIEKPLKVAKPKSILMSVRAPVGDLNIADRFYCIGRGLSCISTFESYAKSEFMWHILHFSVKDLINLGQGSTFQAIGSNEIKSHLLPLPPLTEQQKIAEILETVDNAIEKTDAIIEKYRRIKKGLMADLLTGKIRLIPYGHSEAEGEESPLLTSPKAKKFVIGNKTFVAVPNQRWKNTPIGKIPEGWEVRKLGEIVNIFDSKRIPLDEEYRANIKGEYPYCGATGIIDYIKDYIFEGEFVLIAEDGGKFGAFEDTAYIINGKFWVNNHAHIVKGKENFLENRYLKNFINYIDVTTYISGSTREKLNQAILRSILLPLPPLPEQQLIADVLSQVDEVIEKEIQYKEKLERIKEGLMEDLLTGKVRVNNLIKED